MDTPTQSPYTKDHPFPARVTENRLLNGPGSGKETRHFVVNLEGSHLTYTTGDSLGVFPRNRPSDVEALLQVLGARGDEPVLLPKAAEPIPLGEALRSRLALAGPTRRILETLRGKTQDQSEKAQLEALLDPVAKEGLDEWLEEREFVDVLDEFPSVRLTPQELVDHLRRLMPRLYSIASSPRVYPNEAHLTVAIVRYHTNGRDRVGVCSTFMADRVPLNGAALPVFVSPSHFGVPEDPGRDIIMVGPGTGIAPFRAFLQERRAVGATGRNWLFYGDQRRACDFLYEEEWEGYRKDGVLTRMDTAFSRDQLQKVYVQDRMRQNAAELWAWIKAGAAFYVCGDATRMAKDVDLALNEIVAGQGNMTPAAASDYLKAMKKDRRYQRDVY